MGIGQGNGEGWANDLGATQGNADSLMKAGLKLGHGLWLLPILSAALAAADLTRPRVGPDLVFQERDGWVAVEAEHFFRQSESGTRAWHLTSLRHTPETLPDGDPPHPEGASGGAYLELLPDTRRTHDDPLIHGGNFSNRPGRLGVLHYKIHFDNPGRYYVWVRAYSTGTEDNGLHVGLNGAWPASGQRMQWCEGKDSWRWESRQRTEAQHCGEPHGIYLDIPVAGEHEIQFSMREDGFEFDKFLLTTNREAARPEGVGPAPRVRHGAMPPAFGKEAPDGVSGAATPRRGYPAHWGDPPRIGTTDYRPLPGGYGFGSSTLAAWIRRNLDRDAAASGEGTVRMLGELKRWHAVTLDFEGPQTGETTEPNPFSDYRLEATFVHTVSGETRVVPGFFAADGEASETSATEGNRWRVRFSPGREGEWRWTVSFRAGPDVAVADDAGSGEPWAPLDGRSGTFAVGPSDKRAPDFRARGHLEYVGERYLRFAGDGTRFLKGGVDSPETMLGYADFDGTYRDTSRTNRPPSPNPIIPLPSLRDGLLRFEPHRKDWREGDPTWKGGKGKGLIGGLNYLSSQGVNSAYFLTMNVNGDGMNVWPWIHPWVRDRFDCSKLDQWEIVFEHMTRLGIQLHIVTQETENDHLLDRGFSGRERKLYYRELVARFSHHPAVTWNFGEENVQSDAQRKAGMAWLRGLLPYRQHLVVHNDHWHAKNLRETFDPLLGFEAFTGPAIQDFFWPDVHTHVRHYVRASAEAGHPWVVTGDELGGANFGTLPDADDPDHDDPRRFGLWGTLMAGGAGVEWYFGWQNNSPFSDLSCEDWRTREGMYRQTRIALDFFRDRLPFWRMEPANDAVVGHGTFGLRAPGEMLAIYLPNGSGTRFDLGDRPGLYEVKWFDPRRGGPLQDGNVLSVRGPGPAWTGFPPSETSKDWLALVRRVPETAPATTRFPGGTWAEALPEEVGVHPNGLRHALNYWRMHTGTNGVDSVVMARRGVVFHRGAAADRAHDAEWVTTFLSGGASDRMAAAVEAAGIPIRDGRSGLRLDAWDHARFVHLLLNEGRWGTGQAAPSAWVHEFLRAQASGRAAGAGFEWRVNDPGADGTRPLPDAPPGTFFAAAPGHRIGVAIPEWETVIVRLGEDGDPPDGHASVLNAFLRRLGMAVSPLASE